MHIPHYTSTQSSESHVLNLFKTKHNNNPQCLNPSANLFPLNLLTLSKFRTFGFFFFFFFFFAVNSTLNN